MPEKNENLFIVESQSLDVDEQKKNDILSVIKSCNSLKDAIGKLEEEKLIWYLIGPLRKDEEIRRQISSEWETDFQEFEQSTDVTHKNFEKLLQGKSFLAYSTEDNNFNIRFENEEKPVKISDILRARDEGEVYNISLGENSQITACRKNGNERHYNFTGSSSCEMMINWQAKDSKGDSISCSMTVEVDYSGIKRVVNEPRFGGITSQEEILKLVEQNKEVFINGKTLHQAFTDMGKSVDNQQITKERFTPVSPALDSSGYSSPGSRGSSVPTSSKFSDEDEMFDDDTLSGEEEYKQKELKDEVDEIKKLKEKKEVFAQYYAEQAKQLEDLQLERDSLSEKIKEQDALIKSLTDENKGENEVLKENTHLKRELEKLKERNQKIEEEGDKYRLESGESEKKIKELKDELEKKTKQLAERHEENKQLKKKIEELEQELKEKNSEIENLEGKLKDKGNVQSTDKINEELRKKLEQSEAELNVLQEENVRLKNDMKEVSAVKGNYEKQSAELLSEKEKELNNTKNQLSEEQLKNQELAKELNQLQKEKEDLEKEIQQSNTDEKSLADEIGEVDKSEEIAKLKEEIGRKDSKIGELETNLEVVHKPVNSRMFSL
ncbi:MAG: hypothetical protein ACR5K9_06305 [Wolbachia sp.]